MFSVNTECFLDDGDGNVRALLAHEVELADGRFQKIEGTDFELPCESVLLAMGFVGPERAGLLEGLGVEINERGNVARDGRYATTREKVFVCGDMGRGQSLIVWAIVEGRSCAASVDEWLMGETALPSPIAPDALSTDLTRSRCRSKCSTMRATEPPRRRSDHTWPAWPGNAETQPRSVRSSL